MARQGMLLPNYLHELPPDDAAAAAPGRVNGIRRLLLDAGRVLMLWGWGTLATTTVSSTGNRQPGHAFLALLLWLLGVSLVTFTPTPRRRFPPVARQAAAIAVVTNLVMGCFFPPWN